MAYQTTNTKMWLFNENDAVDWSQINENFKRFEDVYSLCSKKEKKAITLSGLSGNGYWLCKKFTDGTAELDGYVDVTNGSTTISKNGLHISSTGQIQLPYSFSTLYSVQLSVQNQNSHGFVMNTTAASVVDYISFVFASNNSDSNVSKRLYISIKGEIA